MCDTKIMNCVKCCGTLLDVFSEISVPEVITEMEIIDPMLTKTMVIFKTEIIQKMEIKMFKTYRNGNVCSDREKSLCSADFLYFVGY